MTPATVTALAQVAGLALTRSANTSAPLHATTASVPPATLRWWR